MPHLLVATPLNHWTVSRPYAFVDGICIREAVPIRWDVAISKSAISDEDREVLDSTQYWLCATKEYEHVNSSTGNELFDVANATAVALQIICPTGAKHLFLKCQETTEGWDNTGGWHLKPLCTTFFGRLRPFLSRFTNNWG